MHDIARGVSLDQDRDVLPSRLGFEKTPRLVPPVPDLDPVPVDPDPDPPPGRPQEGLRDRPVREGVHRDVDRPFRPVDHRHIDRLEILSRRVVLPQISPGKGTPGRGRTPPVLSPILPPDPVAIGPGLGRGGEDKKEEGQENEPAADLPPPRGGRYDGRDRKF